MSDDPKQNGNGVEIEADTPVGKIIAKGLRASDVLNIATFVAVVVICVLSWQFSTTLSQHTADEKVIADHFISAIKESSVAQRMQTCIMSLPQEKREQEYIAQNGFCHQMSMVP